MPKESRMYFLKAIEFNPQDNDSYMGVGITYEREGDFVRAADYYKQYLAKTKDMKPTPTINEARGRLQRIQKFLAKP